MRNVRVCTYKGLTETKLTPAHQSVITVIKSKRHLDKLLFMSTPKHTPAHTDASKMQFLPNMIFASRWLQMPLYLGLILAQGVYVWHFFIELYHLIFAAFGSQPDVVALVNSIGYKSDVPVTTLNETIIMLVVLALIDVVMISNLLIMVIVGGYETFVSRMNLQDHPDQPEWYFLYPFAQNFYQRRQLHRASADVPNDHSHRVFDVSHGDCVHRQVDVWLGQTLKLTAYLLPLKL
jgi:uncharacterized membrane protein YqhA